MRVVDPLLPVIAAEFDISLGRAGLIITAYSLPYGLCVLGYGPLGDRYGKLHVIILAMAVSAGCIFMCGFATDLPSLIGWRFLSGMSCAATVPLSLAFISDNFPLGERQRAIARYMSGVILGQIVGAGLSGIFADYVGWRSIFLVYGVLTALATLLVWLGARHLVLPVQAASGLRGALVRYRAAFKRKASREVMLAVFIEGMLLFGSTAFIGAMLHNQYHLQLTGVGMLLVCVGVGSLAYTGAVSWLVRVLGQRGMIALGGTLMACCFALLGHSQQWQLAAPLLVVLGFAIYLMHNTLQTLGTELALDARGTSVSLMVFLLFSGQALGAFGLGHAIDHFGYAASYTVIALALGLLGWWLQGTRALAAGLHAKA